MPVGKSRIVSPDSSGADFETLVVHDTNKLRRETRYIYVGGAGNITCLNEAGTAVLFSNVPVGWHPIRTVRVNNSGTTASLMVAIY